MTCCVPLDFPSQKAGTRPECAAIGSFRLSGASAALIVRKQLAQQNALQHGKFPHGGIHAPRAARYDFVNQP